MASIVQDSTNIKLYSEAFKNAVDARFISTEHAGALFKKLLKDAGLEIEKKAEKKVGDK